MKFPNKIGMNLCLFALTIFLFGFSFSSCKKFIEVKAPPTNTYADNVYSDDAQAAAVLTGIYAKISSASILGGGLTSLSLLPSLSADELSLIDPSNQNATYRAYYTNSLDNINTSGADYWYSIYPIVFVANAAIEGLSKSASLTPQVKQQLLGEAKFIRAFCYFYLVNLYGDVPLATTTAPEINRLLSRSPKENVYQQIIADLKDAQNLLIDNYVSGKILTTTSERTSPNKWAATALLARVYLYTEDWVNAEVQATAVINHTALYDTASLNNVFFMNSRESIWQLQPVLTDISNTQEARLFILPASGPNTSQYPVYLSRFLINSFEPGDNRKVNWTRNVVIGNDTFFYSYKYKDEGITPLVTEYTMVLRLAEQFLIRAEARVQQNNISGARSDLNLIRTRAGLADDNSNDKSSLLVAILHERQAELFTEWGHRWFDLKRTGKADEVMNVVTPLKGGTWNSSWVLYPININELNKNPSLMQNQGY